MIKQRENIGEEERQDAIKLEKETEARERAARQAVVHVLMDHGVTQAKLREVSELAGNEIKMLDNTLSKNKQLIKEAEEELLDHVQRLAVMEESEMRRMATEISLVEESAANHGKKPGFFNRPKL